MFQSSFDFPFLDRYLDCDFIASKENERAFNFIQNYDIKNHNLPKIFAIYGEHSCGKTHLAHIWQRKMNGSFLSVNNLQEGEIVSQIESNKSYIIEDIESVKNQIIMFDIFNIILEKNCSLLLTSNKNPELIKYNLADLASRIRNVFAIEIQRPESEFIKILLIKKLADKQLKIDDKIIDFLAKNLDRSYLKIEQFIKLVEFYSFERKEKITQKFVKELLQQIN